MYELPKDPMMLMSFLNQKLRGHYDSLESLCDDYRADPDELKAIVATAGFLYDEASHQFKR